MKKILTATIGLILVIAGCNPTHKTPLEFGEVVLTQEGMVLPVRKTPDSKKPFWCMDLSFESQYVVLRSPRQLTSCFMTFAYEAGGHQDITTVELDFHSLQDGWYVYATSYNWFPPKSIFDKTIQTGIYYIPSDVDIPEKEHTDENGDKYTYPDFTGYYFMLNREESQQYLQNLAGHLL